ncbi:hypothetical protein [Comamonas sp. CMM02]|uniref:hypothetical protein n=1 Tax=Comamonas sp. CMM02 TaxID=2769307 RepID=UPI00178047AC|nr:hypothetical protein [Comamonas sp. CMM02]MBD9402611.1 hypothetical protein [Comamonas sp. CMM02]
MPKRLVNLMTLAACWAAERFNAVQYIGMGNTPTDMLHDEAADTSKGIQAA